MRASSSPSSSISRCPELLVYQASQSSSSSSSSCYTGWETRRVSTASNVLLRPPHREGRERNLSLPSSLLSEELCRTRQFSVSRGKVVSQGESRQSWRASQEWRASSGSSNHCLGQLQHLSADLVKVLMLGAPGVGKSSLCVQFVTSEHVNTYHSVGEALEDTTSLPPVFISDDSVCKEVNLAVNKEEARLLFIDHKHGEISLASQLALYSPDAFLVVMAVDDRTTFSQAEQLLSQLSSRDLLLNKPVILVANKTDLVRNRVVKQSGQYLALPQINMFSFDIMNHHLSFCYRRETACHTV